MAMTARTSTSSIDEAYRICEQISRSEAANFYYGIRLLPGRKRLALCALYALARRIDDIGDGDLPAEEKTAALVDLRRQIATLDSSDPVLAAVADAARCYPVPMDAFDELVDGVQSDVDQAGFATFDDLVIYCRQVAGGVGRLCLSIFGTRNPDDLDDAAWSYADQLGIALQQTNILRDVREDLINGRVYLPQDDLDRAGVRLRLDDHGVLADPDARLAGLLRSLASRAQDWYALGLRLVPRLDHRSAASCTAMAGIYRNLLTKIDNNPTLVYDRRLSLTGAEKARVAVGALIAGSGGRR